MFQRILVPLDLSDRNARALATAAELAARGRARVTLVHVIQRIPNVSTEELRGFYQRLERLSAQRLERMAHRLASKGVPVGVRVCVGEPAREIIAIAAREKADLIVMGSHRVSRSAPGKGWGTTSYKVGIFCRCPILLVK